MKTKGEGEKQPTELFAWLVILLKTHGLNDDWPRPLARAAGCGPFSLCCYWRFSFTGLHPSPERWVRVPVQKHLGSASERTSAFAHGLSDHVASVSIHMYKAQTSSFSKSLFLTAILSKTFPSILIPVIKSNIPLYIYPSILLFLWTLFLSLSHTLHPRKIKTVNTPAEPTEPLIHKS